MENRCQVAEEKGIERIIFANSVAVYGFAPTRRALNVIRPTVVFDSGNRGNVYSLLRQIQSGSFVMVGNGQKSKSMADVENAVAVFAHTLKGTSNNDVSFRMIITARVERRLTE